MEAPPLRMVLALMAAALGDVAEARAASDARPGARASAADPQVLLPALACAAAVDAGPRSTRVR